MSVIGNHRKRVLGFLGATMALAGLVVAFGSNAIAFKPTSKEAKAKVSAADVASKNPTFSQLFIENQGQWPGQAEFMLRSPGINTWVTETGVLYDFYRIRRDRPVGDFKRVGNQPVGINKAYVKGHVVKVGFEGSRPADAVGAKQVEGSVNYLRGSTSIQSKAFQESRLVGLYEGVDMRMYLDSEKPRFDLIVHPGANPNTIRMNIEGANNVRVESPTALDVQTSLGSFKINGLYAYQSSNGQMRQVPCSFEKNADGTISYRLGQYDTSKPLIIDPIVYATLLGGGGSDDSINDVVVDGLVNAFVCGNTLSPVFPTSIGAYDEIPADVEGFVTKFLPDASDVHYSTFVGGTGADSCNGIDIDSSGNAYVVGSTTSTDLATTGGAFQTASGGGQDAFVVKLNPTGTAAVYASYLGGAEDDGGARVQLNAANQAHVVGFTQSVAFPVASAQQGALTGAQDGFLTKFTADGSGVAYSTYIGGTELPEFPEAAVDVAVDIDNAAYVVVNTASVDMPTTPGVWDRTLNNQDAWVGKYDPAGPIVFGTFLGGNSGDAPVAIGLDTANNIYVLGQTLSFNFPKTSNAFDKTYNLIYDCFLTKMSRTGSSLVYSTFLGTSAQVQGIILFAAFPQDLAVDDLGVAHIAGGVSQTTIPNITVTANADQPAYGGGGDSYTQVINENGSNQVYCSYFGAGAFESGNAINIDGARNAYIGGITDASIDDGEPFLSTPGVFKEAFSEPGADPIPLEGFLLKVKTRIPVTITSLVINPDAVASGEATTGTVTLSANASSGGATVSLTNNNASIISHPASIFIAEGSASGTFTINTTENLTSTQTATVSATVEGDVKTDTITVSPWLTALTLSNDQVVGGNLVGGRVTIFRPAPTGGISVLMNSTVPAVATVPNIVTVPTGLVTQTFDVTTVGVANSQLVDITASYGGLTRTVTLDVIPARLDSISFAPTVVSGGTPTTGKVQLNGKAPTGGVTVNLAASDVALTVPATVTINEQEQQTTFEATTSVVTINTTVTITATFGGDTRQTTVDILRATLISLAISPDVVQGGNPTTGTVGLDNPAATGGATVNLSSGNPSVASVPANVTVPSGSTNANFTVATSLVASNTVVQITATRGSVVLNANLTILPVNFTVTVDPDVVTGGSSTVGTVELASPAPQSGVTVNLSSNNSAASVPTTVQLASGQTETTFAISTVPVATTQTVTISGSFNSGTAQDILTVESAGPIGLSVSPDTVQGGNNSTGTVTIDGPAPTGGVVVSLTSNDSAATVPGTVTVNQGLTTRTFTINTSQVAGVTVATITATANGKSAQADLTINSANLLSITFNPKRVRGGQPTAMTVTLDAAAPAGGAVVAVTSSNPTIANIPSTVTVLQGQTSRTVTVTTRRVSRTLSTQVVGTYGGIGVFTILTVTR